LITNVGSHTVEISKNRFLEPWDDLERPQNSPRAPQQTAWKTSSREIYASVGGLVVAPINAPHLFAIDWYR